MSNAVKYTPKGGNVWLTVELVVDKAKISIHDTGVGIPPKKMAKLFERFERGDDTYSKEQEGTGIGLNLTRYLVELNGGRIGVDSEEGKGSTFWVMMPLASVGQTTVTVSDKAEENVRLDGLSAVVVDDNKDTCQVLAHILTHAGANVRTAYTVKDGLALLGESIPDIVLTDLAIPGESGLTLIEAVRRSPSALNKLPIIVLSACAFQADRTNALNAGASVFIPKPFRAQEVVKTVRDLTLSSAIDQPGSMPTVTELH